MLDDLRQGLASRLDSLESSLLSQVLIWQDGRPPEAGQIVIPSEARVRSVLKSLRPGFARYDSVWVFVHNRDLESYATCGDGDGVRGAGGGRVLR